MFSDLDIGLSEENPDEIDQLNDSLDSVGVKSSTKYPAGNYHLSQGDGVEPDSSTNFNDCATLDDRDAGHIFALPLSPIILPEVHLWDLSLEDISPFASDGVHVNQWESDLLTE